MDATPGSFGYDLPFIYSLLDRLVGRPIAGLGMPSVTRPSTSRIPLSSARNPPNSNPDGGMLMRYLQ